MSYFQARTDLALEARESISEADGSLHGVIAEETEKSGMHITTVKITTKNGAKSMGKPMGSYVTIEAPAMTEPDEDCHREIANAIAEVLKQILPMDGSAEKSVLIVGLGNREVIADALGPHVVDQLFITRHMVKEYGMTGRTGMEAAEIIKGVVEQTKPDMMVVVDALAARNVRRLNRTIQITDTGIHPGSGVGNHRNALTEESMGIPVIAIGIPTVVDAATIVLDALEKMLSEESEADRRNYLSECRNAFAELHNMYVTSKDIDAVIKQVSFMVAEGINMALEREK